VSSDPAEPRLDELLTVEPARVGSAVVVAVNGEIDIATGPRLRAALAEALDEPGNGPVVVDLSKVTFLGSTGVAVLVDADWQANQRQRDLRVVVDRERPAVVRPLESTGIDRLLSTYGDLQSALG
jgi:anti-sigma B factor antagonist